MYFSLFTFLFYIDEKRKFSAANNNAAHSEIVYVISINKFIALRGVFNKYYAKQQQKRVLFERREFTRFGLSTLYLLENGAMGRSFFSSISLSEQENSLQGIRGRYQSPIYIYR